MTIKFDVSAANQYLSMADSAGLTYPAGDFCVGLIMSVDSISPDQTQYLVSNGPYQTSGSLNIAYLGGTAGFMSVYGASNTITGAKKYTSGVFVFVIQRTGGVLTIRSCPILSSAPVDGSSVLTDASGAFTTGTLDGSGGLVIGARSDLSANRFANQSIGRVFRYDGTLTDLEVAKLAYGMEITDLGYTPAWYVKMETVSDITDRGALANTVTAHGSYVNGTVPAFGYTGAAVAPAISADPVIVGGAPVGSASSVTLGTVTGSPAPTVTLQWNYDGVPISGATGTTHTSFSADVGKAKTVSHTANNGVGSPVTRTSAAVIVTAATSTVDVVQVTAERIYQRISGAAPISFSGTYTGTAPTSIEYQLYAADGVTILVPWTAVAGATISGGNWLGVPQIPQGGMYRLSVRSKNGSTVLATSNVKANLFGVGDLIGCIGSSSANRWFLNNSGSGFTPASNVRRYQAGAWALMSTDGCATAMANSFASQAGVPVGMIGYGVEGETLANWINTSSSSWAAFAAAVAAVGGKLATVISAGGSNDAANGIVVSRAAHATSLRQLATNLRTLTGQAALLFCISGFNRRPAVSDSQADYVRMAENDVGSDANVAHVQIVDLELSSDLIHLTPAGFTASGARMATVFGAVMNGGAYRRGPKLTGLTYSGNTVVFTLQHRNGSDFTPTAAIAGFTISDSDPSGVAPTISSVVRTSTTQGLITCNRTLVNPVVKYLYGSSPVSAGQTAPANELFDNGTTPLPMAVETSLTATATAVLATTVTFTVAADASGTAVPDTTGLDYAFYDSPRISAGQAPIKYGSTLAITNGTVTLDITGLTSLAPGATGRIVYGPADGSKIAGGQVVVH